MVNRLIGICILFLGVWLIGSIVYNQVMKPSAAELAHKEELKIVAQNIAKIRIEEKKEMYKQAIESRNKGVACKISREMVYWAAQTGDIKIVGNIHQLQYEACGH